MEGAFKLPRKGEALRGHEDGLTFLFPFPQIVVLYGGKRDVGLGLKVVNDFFRRLQVRNIADMPQIKVLETQNRGWIMGEGDGRGKIQILAGGCIGSAA